MPLYINNLYPYSQTKKLSQKDIFYLYNNVSTKNLINYVLLF